MRGNIENDWECECLLDNGKILRYDCCVTLLFWSENPNCISENIYKYIGDGVIYSVNGYRQSGKEKCRFYVYK